MNAKQRVQRQLEDLLKQPGNDRCADCRSLAPRWASTNLGIFLCITCASVHRKMGTHRSRVKSVTLDEWTREQVSFMREMGNTKSNAIYNPDERMHPPPSVTSNEERDSEIAKYIRRKYELRAFARGADKSLASSHAVTSRARAQAWHAGTNGDASPTDTKKDLPALPAPPPPPSSSRRPVRSPSGPVWSGLTANTTGSSSGTSAASRTSASGSGSASAASAILTSAPTRSGSLAAPTQSPVTVSPARSPAFGAQPLPQTQSQQQAKADPNLLIDLSGTTSSTRPLQVNNFPTVPYQGQPPAATPAFAPLPSPGATSPLSLGQQAFPFQQLSPGNPFQQQGSYFQPMQGVQSMSGSVSPGVGMGMQGAGGMGGGMGGGMTMGMGMNTTMPNGMQMGSLSVPMGMNSMSPMSPMGGMNGMSPMNTMGPMNTMNGINTMNPMYASAYPQQQGWYVQGM